MNTSARANSYSPSNSASIGPPQLALAGISPILLFFLFIPRSLYRCHEDSKFHLLFSLCERKTAASAAVAVTTTTTTRRDGFFHTARTRHLSSRV